MTNDDQRHSNTEDEGPEDPEFPIGGFVARGAAIEESNLDQTFMVSLAEQENGAGESITIAIMLVNSQQDIDLGLDTYCVSNGWGATVYGGITAYRMDDRRLTLYLSQDAARRLKTRRTFVIDLQIGDDDIEKLRRGLARILGVGT
jgi:hypothetical protein